MDLSKTETNESTVLVEMPLSVYQTFFSHSAFRKIDLKLIKTEWDRRIDIPSHKLLKEMMMAFFFIHKGKRVKVKSLSCLSNSCHKEFDFVLDNVKIYEDCIDIPRSSMISKGYSFVIKFHDIFYAEVIDSI